MLIFKCLFSTLQFILYHNCLILIKRFYSKDSERAIHLSLTPLSWISYEFPAWLVNLMILFEKSLFFYLNFLVGTLTQLTTHFEFSSCPDSIILFCLTHCNPSNSVKLVSSLKDRITLLIEQWTTKKDLFKLKALILAFILLTL